MYNPLNCSIITEVYQATSEAGRPIPHSQTQLYTEMTLWCLSRYLSDIGDPLATELPQELSELPHDSNLYQQLLKLGKIAFEGKLKEKVIYDSVDLPNDCTDLGLLVKHCALYRCNKSTTYNFFHLTMQEYMSAFYIAQLPAHKQKFLFRIRAKSMDVVWRFVAGLTKMKQIGWDTVYGGIIRALFLEYVFEAQDTRSICDQHVFKSQEVEYASTELSSSVATALGYCISGLNKSWNLQLANLSEISVKMLDNGMHMNDGSGSITTLRILVSPGIMGHLLCMSPRNLRFIKTLSITDCAVGNSGFCDFARCIPYLNSLISLDISGSSIVTSFAAMPMMEAHPESDYSNGHPTSNASTIQRGVMNRAHPDYGSGIALPPGLRSSLPSPVFSTSRPASSSLLSHVLSTLHPSRSTLPPPVSSTSRAPRPISGLVKVIQALQRHRNLQSLAMTSIPGMGAEEGEALLNLVQSKECCLTELKIGASGLQNVISQILTLSTSLKSLSISAYYLRGVDHLSNNISTLYLHGAPLRDSLDGRKLGNIMIEKNKTLKELGLDIPINKKGLRYILHSLSTNTTLERLKLRKWGHFEFLSQHERETIDPRVEFAFYD